MESREFTGGYDHQVIITNREHVTIKGVIHVDSFDDQEVMMETDLGILVIRGEELNIKQLSLDEGVFSVEGYIHAVQYHAGGKARGSKARGKGWMDKLFR